MSIKRPKYIRITIYWKYSNCIQHQHLMDYDHLDMLDGWYRRLIGRLKNLFLYDPLWREARVKNGNVLRTKIEFIHTKTTQQ